MSFTNNYSQVAINEINKNFEFLVDSTSVSNKSFHLSLQLSMNLRSLDFQAYTFSENYRSHGYINFFKTLRIRENEVLKKLHDLYIYSYAKCLYNGIYYATISEKSDLGYAFRGHSSLYYILRMSGHSDYYKKNLLMSWNIDLGNEAYKQAMLVKLIAQYPFLNKFREFSLDTFGTKPFQIQEYEAYLNYLSEDFYSRDHVAQGEKRNAEEISGSTSSYSNGKLSLVRMNESHSSSMSSFSLNPVMNAFLSSNGSEFIFIPVGNGKTVENNPSLFFNKANFIKLRSEGNDELKIQRYYRRISVDENLLHTVCSEVFTNTGIICRFIPNKSFGDSFKSISTRKVAELIDKAKGKTTQDILSLILDKIEQLDIDEIFNELLDEGVK